jgi:hypothetical protein
VLESLFDVEALLLEEVGRFRLELDVLRDAPRPLGEHEEYERPVFVPIGALLEVDAQAYLQDLVLISRCHVPVVGLSEGLGLRVRGLLREPRELEVEGNEVGLL